MKPKERTINLEIWKKLHTWTCGNIQTGI